VIVAPGIAAPLASWTLPTTEPYKTCAVAARGATSAHTNARDKIATIRQCPPGEAAADVMLSLPLKTTSSVRNAGWKSIRPGIEEAVATLRKPRRLVKRFQRRYEANAD
jgi:hypothetical protein